MLQNELMNSMEEEGDNELPSFDGAGWLRGVKILSGCLKEERQLTGLWKVAKHDEVDRDRMPQTPKAKVFIPSVMPPQKALKLLKRQN